MNEALTILPKDINEAKVLAKDLAVSSLLPAALRRKPEDVLVIVLTGAELGIAPMASARGIHVINGKAVFSADLMAGIALTSKPCEYLIVVESSPTVCTYRAKRKGAPSEVKMSFTIDEAKSAGLLTKDSWRHYPADMLRARALGRICRTVFPDVLHGCYVEGEIDPEPEKDVTPQAAHVETVKEALKAAVAAPTKPEPVEAEIVEEKPAVLIPTVEAMTAKIKAANSDTLKALIPALKALPPGDQAALKSVFNARKQELQTRPA